MIRSALFLCGLFLAAGVACSQSVVLTQSNDPNTIQALNSVNCNTINLGISEHRDNHYLRIYDMPGGESAAVSAVRVGILEASSGSGTQPVEIRLYEVPSGANFPAPLTAYPVLRIETFQVADDANPRFERFQFAEPVVAPAGSRLLVDVYTPPSNGAGNLLFIGANDAGETGQSYTFSRSCGLSQPTPLFAIGWPFTAWTIDVEVYPEAPIINPSETAAPGAIAFSNDNLQPGSEILNVFSLQPCPGQPGSGPFFGLCANDVNDLLAFLLVPVGTRPVRFIAASPSETHAPIVGLPAGLVLDAFAIDLTSFRHGPVSRLQVN